jgi:hypothetical protein
MCQLRYECSEVVAKAAFGQDLPFVRVVLIRLRLRKEYFTKSDLLASGFLLTFLVVTTPAIA